MLFKTLFLLFIAWYVYRAAGNLINAARGDRQQMTSDRESDIRVNRGGKDEPSVHHQSSMPADVEDAQFRDL